MVWFKKYRLAISLFLISAIALSQTLYIEAKALLAQYLLVDAWEQTLEKKQIVKPWAWADTHPVAKLKVEAHNIEQIVLAGASGRSLAFGPGHLLSSANPETQGHVIIGGHRDTHFNFLQELKVGQQISLQDNLGKEHLYQVKSLEIHNSQEQQLQDQGKDILTLVTCYPFNTLEVGGPLRYLVHAEKLI